MVAGRSEFQPWHRRAEQLAAEGADCITAGFPCQDISFAGAGAGLAGARTHGDFSTWSFAIDVEFS